MPNNIQAELSHKFTLRIIELVFTTIVLSLIFRPFFIDLPIYFLLIGIAELFLMTGFYFIVRLNLLPKWEITLSLLIALIIILPTLAISGGVNSQMVYFLPLYPILAALLGGHRESLALTVTLVAGTILATIFSEYIVDLTGGVYSKEMSTARGFWLTISIILSAFFGHFFLQRYTEVTKQLKEENTLDPLTGLLNRRGLNTHFSKELEETAITSSPLSLILIDIDYFKKINDRYGHDVGDICLIEVANVLSNTLRKRDIIARFGGEEFIIILPNTTKNEAALIADGLKKVISKQKFSDFNLPITITLGVTDSRGQHDNALKMIKRADKALYRGKDKGRNCVELSE
jgi:diguanylate cyclase (GGDEF)-like protein